MLTNPSPTHLPYMGFGALRIRRMSPTGQPYVTFREPRRTASDIVTSDYDLALASPIWSDLSWMTYEEGVTIMGLTPLLHLGKHTTYGVGLPIPRR